MRTFALGMTAVVVLLTGITNLGYGAPIQRFLRHVPGGDTTGHFALYGLFALAVVSWLSRRSWAGSARVRLQLIGALALLVTLEELSQALLPTRTFSLLDLAASLGGLTLGSCVALWLAGSR